METTKLIATFSLAAAATALAGSDSLIIAPEVKELRPLAADRPDATETPITVDKGHFQVESTVLGYARDKRDGVTTELWTFAETNLKYGVTDNLDISLLLAPYSYERISGGGEVERNKGFGDIVFGAKYNLWGNDSGQSAMALMPYLKVPTGTALSNDEFEGGLILPFAFEVNDRFDIGLQAEFASVWNDESGEREFEFAHTAVVGIALTEKCGTYIEYLGVAGEDDYEAYGSFGFTYDVNSRFSLDAGALIGLNDAADDLATFTGFSVKF